MLVSGRTRSCHQISDVKQDQTFEAETKILASRPRQEARAQIQRLISVRDVQRSS